MTKKELDEIDEWLFSEEALLMSSCILADRVKHMHIKDLIENDDLTIQQKLEEALDFIIPNKKNEISIIMNVLDTNEKKEYMMNYLSKYCHKKDLMNAQKLLDKANGISDFKNLEEYLKENEDDAVMDSIYRHMMNNQALRERLEKKKEKTTQKYFDIFESPKEMSKDEITLLVKLDDLHIDMDSITAIMMMIKEKDDGAKKMIDFINYNSIESLNKNILLRKTLDIVEDK